jgi:hypothetical protein
MEVLPVYLGCRKFLVTWDVTNRGLAEKKAEEVLVVINFVLPSSAFFVLGYFIICQDSGVIPHMSEVLKHLIFEICVVIKVVAVHFRAAADHQKSLW